MGGSGKRQAAAQVDVTNPPPWPALLPPMTTQRRPIRYAIYTRQPIAGLAGHASAADAILKALPAEWLPLFASMATARITSIAASMGPRLFSRGKDEFGALRFECTRWLQWGRGCLAAERSAGRGLTSRPSAPASMGPRLFSRGKVQWTGIGE